MKDINVINCTAYTNGINSPLEYLNITTPAEFKVVMDLLCYYAGENASATAGTKKQPLRGAPSGGTWHKITEPGNSGSVIHIFL